MMALFTWLCALALSIGTVHGNSAGPPLGVCTGLIPVAAASPPHMLQNGTGGYTITTDLTLNYTSRMYMYTADQTYSVTVQAASGTTFRGFLVRSVDPSGTGIGVFTTTNAQQQLLNCPNNAMTTITHSNAALQDFPSQMFNWTAPNGNNGYVNFMFTVVPLRPQYYGLLNAALNRPATVSTPTRSIDDYRLKLRSPAGCERSACDIYVGIDNNAGNNGYLDMYLEATAEAWVGVGFSTTRSMFDADVVACNIATNSSFVEAVDTLNGPSTGRTNTLDAVQDVSLYSGSLSNGRLSCTLTRSIAGSNIPTDLNLDADLWVMYGWANKREVGGALAGHAEIPTITSSRINVVTQGSVANVVTQGSVAIAATPLVLALLVAAAVFENKA